MRKLAVLLCLPLLYGFSLESLFAPKAKLWARWQSHAEQPSRAVDHAVWGQFLKRYVVASDDGVNRVRYGSVAQADRDGLRAYLQTLQQEAVSRLTRTQQLAYWINLYNAKTVHLVLEHYPVESIRKIKLGGGFGGGPWKARVLTVEGEALSLNDVEHRILRPIWKDPRVHYGLNCASLGCPNVQAEAFAVDNVEALLDKSAREYVNHPRAVAFDESGKLRLSSIYNWFKSDFGKSRAELIAHLKRFAAPALRQRLDRVPEIAGYAYDWSLNDAGSG